ncbi:MAG: PIG-L family deacetylase [Streptosporangiales bacterium]
MRRFGLTSAVTAGLTLLASLAVAVPANAATSGDAHQAKVAEPYRAPKSVKIDVMGEWAHPDDDTSIIGPCGVWHQRYDIRCGIIMVTRGEGGANAVGNESGPALGLRRENEDRVAHYRSGTMDLFYLDRVDFFYNQSAPLTQHFWDHEETLRRITRIIRMTQPGVYVGWTPTLAAGHGNHQEAGRFIWEGMLAAADPTMFPDQLRGPHALSTWQVKKVFSGGSTDGTGGTTKAPNCTSGFVPAQDNLDTVAGVWTGYDSPYKWPEGNVQGQPAGTPKIWQQVANEGRSAYPTQSRVMYQGLADPACPRFGMTDAFVPFQPNTRPDGSANPLAGKDDAILYGATVADPGGFPRGTLEHLTFSRFYNVPGVPFKATLHVKAPRGKPLPAGKAALTVPDGWTVDGPKSVGSLRGGQQATATFTVTPASSAHIGQQAKVSALLTAGSMTGYTDQVVQVVPPAEGRFHRWGKWAEYDNWLGDTAPPARRLGRSDAVQPIAVGHTATVPVDVHNWSDKTQQGEVKLELPDDFTADATAKSYGSLAPGADTTVKFQVTNTDDSLPADQNASIPITTTFSAPSGSGSEKLQVSIVPDTVVSQAKSSPVVDGKASSGEYPGAKLDIGRIWQGERFCTGGTADCGVSGGDDSDSSYAKVSWSDDALYFFTHVRDDYQSYAVTPKECVAHWLADSVEFQIDPRGDSSQHNMDTATTFKLGVFPFTDDPDNTNGNGANGPCWERDADNHQGYSTGPLADTVPQAPNAPGVKVASSATWVGDNKTTTDHSYAGGGYDLEVKIPMADLPAAVDPQHMGLNITPYDNDDTSAKGTTTLRHIDNSTRLGWSAFGSVQSDPYRWGVATLDGYTPPSGRPTTPPDPIIGHPNLNGTDSPQTIWQSARNGVPIAGKPSAPRTDHLSHANARLTRSSVELTLAATGKGDARAFSWTGDVGQIPVYKTSCSKKADPPPDYGMTACDVTDGGTPPWSPDMSGHVVADTSVSVHRGAQHVSVPISTAEHRKLARDGRVLVSFSTPDGEVQALDVPLT